MKTNVLLMLGVLINVNALCANKLSIAKGHAHNFSDRLKIYYEWFQGKQYSSADHKKIRKDAIQDGLAAVVLITGATIACISIIKIGQSYAIGCNNKNKNHSLRNVNAKDQDENELMEAIKSKDLPAIKNKAEKLKGSRKFLPEASIDGQTFITQAALDGDPEVVRLLIDLGAYIDAINNESESALLIAARAGNIPIVKLLLQQDEIELESDDFCRKTALDYAHENGHTAIAQMLQEAGAKK